MLNEVRIYGADGALKRTVPPEEVTRLYWRERARRDSMRARQIITGHILEFKNNGDKNKRQNPR